VSDKNSWQRYEELRRIVLLLWASWFPFVFLAGWWTRNSLDRIPPLLVVVIVVWTLGVAGMGLRLGFWPCPRCGKRFFLTSRLQRAGGKECPHCGLPYGHLR
jgi:hypothetical protein